MKQVLVTGCAGFIGSRVCEMLLENTQIQVVGIDNLNDYYDVTIKNRRLDKLYSFPQFKFYPSDIEDLENIENIFHENSFSVVYHLAARAGVRNSIQHPQLYFGTNVLGVINLLECSHRHQVPKFILASTSSLYSGQEGPFNEEASVNHPISPYAASKKAAETVAFTYHHLYGIDVSILRYFTVFGPNGRPDMAPDIFLRSILQGKAITIYGDGNQNRDFTFIDDIARGTILAEKSVGYEITNLGQGQSPVSILQFIHWIEELTGQKAKLDFEPFHVADMKSTHADIRKAEKLFGWKPQTDTYSGIRKMIEESW